MPPDYHLLFEKDLLKRGALPSDKWLRRHGMLPFRWINKQQQLEQVHKYLAEKIRLSHKRSMSETNRHVFCRILHLLMVEEQLKEPKHTLEWLARQVCGVKPSTLRVALSRGITTTKPLWLRRLADFFQVQPSDFWEADTITLQRKADIELLPLSKANYVAKGHRPQKHR